MRDVIADHAARIGVAAGPIELMTSFAGPVTTAVISAFAGVPLTLQADFVEATSLPLLEQRQRLVGLCRWLLAEPRGRLQRDISEAVDGRITETSCRVARSASLHRA
jgi:cytochrome P450